jgi:hypothetical protein
MYKNYQLAGGPEEKKHSVKKLSCIYRMWGREKKHILCKKTRREKNYQLAGGLEERMHFIKNSRVKKNTPSHACFPCPSSHTAVSGFGEVNGG